MDSVRSRLARLGAGALVGILAGGVALGVGELVAGLIRPAASPIVVVGNRLILLTPEPIKRWAIREFGTNDKRVLLTGIAVGIAAFAVVIGWLSMRRLVYGVVGIILLGVVGCVCAWSTAGRQISDAVPTVVGTLAGLVALTTLQRSSTELLGESAVDTQRLTNRRRFLQVAAGAAGVAALSGVAGRIVQNTRFDASAARRKIVLPTAAAEPPPLPNGVDLGKSGVPFQTPNSAFYRVDTALAVPQIDPAGWRLRIHGLVDRELTITYQQLLARPQIERWITMTCVSNEVGGDLVSTARFLGVRLADLLREVGVHPDADQLLATSVDGMTIGSPTSVVLDGRDAMLAVGMNGEPLPIVHGFPVRMVVPGLYGYVSACKWIVDLQATRFADTSAYWVQQGWAARGPIRLASRIDRPRSGSSVTAGSTVPIAGVAWDQHVGVDKVEVQVDNGPWTAARLAAVPSADTWRQWVLPWTVPGAGSHTIRVRATDAQGHLQDATPRDPFPAGATGWHSVVLRAR
jgi:DMSO/TMAO reductase YedYZ molybdopterin-dependent catalytic subunit